MFFFSVPLIYQSQYSCIRKADSGHVGNHRATETEPGVTNGGKKDRHCTHTVTLRRVRATIVAVAKKNKYYIF